MEEWRPAPGFEGRYEVSNCGRVRRVLLNGKYKYRATRKLNTGYLAFHARLNGRDKAVTVHRLVALAFLGPPPEGYEVDHIDFDRTNSHVSNLQWVSHSHNMKRIVLAGRQNQVVLKGERHGRAKLCDSKVREIREMLDKGHKPVEASRKFMISTKTVNDIRARRTWAHI